MLDDFKSTIMEKPVVAGVIVVVGFALGVVFGKKVKRMLGIRK